MVIEIVQPVVKSKAIFKALYSTKITESALTEYCREPLLMFGKSFRQSKHFTQASLLLIERL